MHHRPQFVDTPLLLCENGIVVTNKISECRVARKISKAHLARRIHRSRAYVTQVEKGALQPGAEVMLRIALYFKKPVEEIFQLVEEEIKRCGEQQLSQSAGPANGLKASICETHSQNNFPDALPSALGNKQQHDGKEKVRKT